MGDYLEYISRSLEDTISVGKEMAKRAKAGDVLCLSGPLGAGKTAFAKGFARGLGTPGHISSPTFTIMQIYDNGRLPLYHFDLYRLEGMFEDSAEDIGFFDYLDGCGVTLIEWAEYAEGFLPDRAIWVEIERIEDGSCEDGRKIYVREV